MVTPAPFEPVSEAMVPRRFHVSSNRQETRDTFTLHLEPDDGPALEFQPGQFTMLYVFGVGEVPISISGDPGRPDTLVHTIRAVGAVTDALLALGEGDSVGVRGPFGTSWPVAGAEGGDLLVVAGGIGLAPLRPVLYHALAHRARYGRVSLVYGARSPSDLIYRDELADWGERVDLDVEVTVDISESGWLGDVGMVTGLLPRVPIQVGRTVAMLCGPEVMMKAVARHLISAGIPSADIRLSIERNMKCAIGLCGHCQFGPDFVCTKGPVFSYADVAERLTVVEI